MGEGGGKSFSIYLAQAAHAGDKLTLAVAGGVSGNFKAILGDSTVAANGAVITLAEGQTQVSFALVQDGEVSEDLQGALSVRYQGKEQASSNSWALTLRDAGESDNTLNGDFLVKKTWALGAGAWRTIDGRLIWHDVNLDGALVAVPEGQQYYYEINHDEDRYGNLLAASGDDDSEKVTDNTLFGSEDKDAINGLSGNDLLSGGAGNDTIDGGTGDDMIGGGAGADSILGGDGDDFISSSADIVANRQQQGPTDLWKNWGLPQGKQALHQGSMWGVYMEGEATIWSGIGDVRTDTASTEGDVIDAGAGDDQVIGSWAADRIQGGEGKDGLSGLAGDDIIEGGAGDDTINADGIAKAGYVDSVDAAHHGADFVDGGEGDDVIDGGGGADTLYGGDGKDKIYGDTSADSGSEFFVALAFHGDDYLDGEDGDDMLWGDGGTTPCMAARGMTS